MIGMTAKNRKGRKRKSGRRTASGAIVRKAINYRSLAEAQPHRAWLPRGSRSSEKAGTVLGSMNILKIITDEQYEAGRRYAQIFGAYLSTVSAPTGTAGNGKGFDCPADQMCRDKPELCPCALRRNRYMAAYTAISQAGRLAHMVINHVVIRDLICPAWTVVHLRSGLNELVEHFGLPSNRA